MRENVCLSINFGCNFLHENVILDWKKTEFVMNPVGLEALSDLKLFADGPFRFRAIHLWLEGYSNFLKEVYGLLIYLD